ncbi:MAG: molybdopterin-dependent oxidoreductase, partial [Gammaproteobacteria bacterium]|nr:molybdopterin-dependent oxidoreductase [Gammaproteobacteria bacterium]
TDLEQAGLLVLVGSNAAWCHPVVYQRIVAARDKNPAMKIIVIDPRRTATCDEADLHLPLIPGSDVILFNGLLNYLYQNDALDRDFINKHTDDFEPALSIAHVCSPSVEAVATNCGLDARDVELFYREFLEADRTVTLFSQGVNQSSAGTDKVNAIINCHLATGRIGRPGAGPFSITGQPNAMGGREVGGLANQLAAHMDIENPAHRDLVQRFWDAPVIAGQPGHKAVDMFNAIHRGEIKTLWIMATNPVVSLPDADFVRAAIRKCETVIVSDCMHDTDTTRQADVLLPALTWGEKDGTVTNSERRISRQRKFLLPPGEARADWWIISEVAKRMGHDRAFDYRCPADIFREHARLSACENGGNRDFDISGLAELKNDVYEQLQPVQWPVSNNPENNAHIFSDGHFYTGNGRAKFIAVGRKEPANQVSDQYPLVLNTGRVRDHWHTLTRTGKSPRLSQHISEPCIEIHPQDALDHALVDGQLARVESEWGSVIARVKIEHGQLAGSIFMPMHWNDQFAARARVDSVVNPAIDPVSGQPESKHTPVRIEPFIAAWEGFLLTTGAEIQPGTDYWVLNRGYGHWCYQVADSTLPADPGEWAMQRMPETGPEGEWLEYHDPAIGRYRAARLVNGQLQACLFIAPDTSQLPDRQWLQSLFSESTLDKIQRACLLAGRQTGNHENLGPVICSCFGVRKNTITRNIIEKNLKDTAAIGQCLKAGTNCGSCLPELKNLIKSCELPDSDAA